MKDFKVRKFYFYDGPNFYLEKQALVFNLYLDPDGYRTDFYEQRVVKQFPQLKGKIPGRMAELFAEIVIQVLKMDINLFLSNYAISMDGEEHVVAVEYLDSYTAEDAVCLVSEWFTAMNDDNSEFDFTAKFEVLQQDFDKTLFGGPTLYSLIEAGMKRQIPVNFLPIENEFQWGYGKKQLRGRSTTFHKDGIKDTEFTMFKDMVGEFLEMCGFPTPQGTNCFTEEEALEAAEGLGYPVVVKPVSGHKGQGVTTGIESKEEVRKAFQKIIQVPSEDGSFDGILVQQQIYGTDHRLLAVSGKCAAALERVPAYVDGNGRDTIKALIEIENSTVVRLDNARSPLCKIHIDDDLNEYLALQDLRLDTVPKEGERITLRRVANISQGGVSINVTDKIHPKNIKMVEDISKYFSLTCLGIDVLAEDISKPWDEGNFGIIEINAGPGVFMHLAPAIGGSIDVPGKIIESHFPKQRFGRIPIIAGNNLSLQFSNKLYEKIKKLIPKEEEYAALTDEGVHFNGSYFFKNKQHVLNVGMILRNPKAAFALFNHRKDEIFDYGFCHEGADVIILDNPHEAEEVLKRDLLPGGYLFVIDDKEIVVHHENEISGKFSLVAEGKAQNKDTLLLAAIEPLLKDLVNKYE
ncbi:MAG: cyanophycin synthetase [bacterium]|nr:cyanophycin synthetase [bacterium]